MDDLEPPIPAFHKPVRLKHCQYPEFFPVESFLFQDQDLQAIHWQRTLHAPDV
jgi:hypothetical protein